MPRYKIGDYVKVEFSDERTLESEWMWVRVERCDEECHVLFGRLDSVSVLHVDTFRLGQRLAVSFSNIREHMKPTKSS
jgi:hypothetical protein